ncbi:MAG: hypothetical protein H6707_19665 [Deltaproteobacteria bacterium]|nr:hypothetical protein [Deltaproteobacteria bacterium]
MRLQRNTMLLIALSVVLIDCSNRPPQISPIDKQTFAIDRRNELKFKAGDPDGDRLFYAFRVVELPKLRWSARANIGAVAGGGLFSWEPTAVERGIKTLELIASDGDRFALTHVEVDVRITNSDISPRFVAPAAPGVSLSVGGQSSGCLEVAIEVADPDTEKVEIKLEPAISGATITPNATDGHRAVLNWCPNPSQIAQGYFTLNIVADDGENAPVRINDGEGFVVEIVSS